jgi:hypothetical protein
LIYNTPSISARLGSPWPGSARPGPARLGSARLGSARPGPARPGPARLGSARPARCQKVSKWFPAAQCIIHPLNNEFVLLITGWRTMVFLSFLVVKSMSSAKTTETENSVLEQNYGGGKLRNRLCSARLGSARRSSVRPGLAWLGLGSPRLASARPISARFGSARLGSARLGSVRLGSAIGIFRKTTEIQY